MYIKKLLYLCTLNCGIVYIRERIHMIVAVLLLCSTAVWGQGNSLNGPVHYQASDSMIMLGNGTAFLHGNGDLKYETMELKSEYIRMNMDSSLIYARGVYGRQRELRDKRDHV